MGSNKDKRRWYGKARYQGLGLMAIGFALLSNPVTAPFAGSVITVGTGWASGGAVSKAVRKKVNDE